MSIKIEGGDGTAENVIKAGTSNELLYNDKEVLLKENLNLGLGLLPPDLSKTQESILELHNLSGIVEKRSFTVPENGWIVKLDISVDSDDDKYHSYFIKIDGFGELGITPSQDAIGTQNTSIIIRNLSCPYPVNERQVVTFSGFSDNITGEAVCTVIFAPCMSV